MPKFRDKPDPVKLSAILKNHGIEVWEGCAVEVYATIHEDERGRPILGEKLVPLESFKTYQAVRDWLGY